MIAGHFVIPEVCVYFGHKLFRGNRCTKVRACAGVRACVHTHVG